MGQEVFTFGRVDHEGRSCQEKRAFLGQDPGVDRADRPRRLTEGHHHAHRPQAVEGLHKGGLADRVVDHIYPTPFGDIFYPLGEILLPVEDRVGAAVLLRSAGLLRTAHCADNGRPDMTGPLADERAHSPGCGMNEESAARLHRIAAFQEISGCHTLQHHGRPLPGGNLLGQFHQPVSRNISHLGVGARRLSGVGHPVALPEFGHALPHHLYRSGPFQAGNGGKCRQRIEATPVIDIDKVEADRLMDQPDFARFRHPGIVGFPGKDFGSASGMHPDCVCHGSILLICPIVTNMDR